MTAVSRFDLLAGRGAAGPTTPPEQLDQLAGKFVESFLANLGRGNEYEHQFGPKAYDPRGLQSRA